MALLALGALLWKEVPWDVVVATPETAPPSGPTSEPSQPSTVAQSPASATTAKPAAQPQQTAAPKDPGDAGNKSMVWESVIAQISEIAKLLDEAMADIDDWNRNTQDNSAQSISEKLNTIASKARRRTVVSSVRSF
jgi:hypothetical protein